MYLPIPIPFWNSECGGCGFLLPNREVVSAHVRVRGTRLTSHLPVAEASDPP